MTCPVLLWGRCAARLRGVRSADNVPLQGLAGLRRPAASQRPGTHRARRRKEALPRGQACCRLLGAPSHGSPSVSARTASSRRLPEPVTHSECPSPQSLSQQLCLPPDTLTVGNHPGQSHAPPAETRKQGTKRGQENQEERLKRKGGGGFPGGAVVENPPASAGDTGSSPDPGRSHMPRSNWAREPQLLSLRVWSLCSVAREAAMVRGPRTAMRSGPRLPQMEKALAQKRRHNAAINK